MRLSLGLPVDLRKGDVGGERGFEAALALRSLYDAESFAEGEERKTMMPIRKTAPSSAWSGLKRRNRIDRIALSMWLPYVYRLVIWILRTCVS